MLLALAGCSAPPGSGRPVPAVTIAPGASPVTEGAAVQFTVEATPAPAADLPVSVTVTEAGARLLAAAPRTVTLPAGATVATLTLPTAADAAPEPDSAVTATVTAGRGYTLGAGMASARVLVAWECDAPHRRRVGGVDGAYRRRLGGRRRRHRHRRGATRNRVSDRGSGLGRRQGSRQRPGADRAAGVCIRPL